MAAEAAVAPVDLPVSDKLSILKQPVPAPKGRKLGILVTDGADGAVVDALKAAAKAAEASVMVLAPKVGAVKLAGGTQIATANNNGGLVQLWDTADRARPRLATDIATRLLRFGPDVKLGVFISVIGAPFFLWLVLHLRRVSP